MWSRDNASQAAPCLCCYGSICRKTTGHDSREVEGMEHVSRHHQLVTDRPGGKHHPTPAIDNELPRRRNRST